VANCRVEVEVSLTVGSYVSYVQVENACPRSHRKNQWFRAVPLFPMDAKKKKKKKKAEGRKQVGEEGWEKEIRDSRRGGGASVPFGAANKWILKGRWGEG